MLHYADLTTSEIDLAAYERTAQAFIGALRAEVDRYTGPPAAMRRPERAREVLSMSQGARLRHLRGIRRSVSMLLVDGTVPADTALEVLEAECRRA